MPKTGKALIAQAAVRFRVGGKEKNKMIGMMKPAISAVILSLILSGVMIAATGCAGNRYQRSTGDYVDDKATSARVKTALFRDAEVSGFDVGVSVYRGTVQLNGFVETPEQRDRAAEIARNVEGVAEVVNNLQMKPAPDAVGAPGRAAPGVIERQEGPAPVRPADLDAERDARGVERFDR
jgi:hyperosmotically inducible periplasmic protein